MVTKFHSVPTVVDNVRFASKAEAHRYRQLKILLQAGHISNLQLQVRYKIEVNGQHICEYVSDFDYVEKGLKIVEDVKGMRTSVYKLKKKLMKAVLNIDILEA